MTDLEHSFDDDEAYQPNLPAGEGMGALKPEGLEETEALGIDSDHIESENEPQEPTGAPEGMHFDSEEEKQAFLAEVEATLSGENDGKAEAEFVMGLTPMGTVGIRVSDEDGDSVNYFISDPSEAWEIAGHLQSLATIMVQTRYAMAMQEQRMVEEMMKKQDLYVPGHGKIG